MAEARSRPPPRVPQVQVPKLGQAEGLPTAIFTCGGTPVLVSFSHSGWPESADANDRGLRVGLASNVESVVINMPKFVVGARVQIAQDARVGKAAGQCGVIVAVEHPFSSMHQRAGAKLPLPRLLTWIVTSDNPLDRESSAYRFLDADNLLTSL